MIEARGKRHTMVEEPVPEFHLDPPGGAVQKIPPKEAPRRYKERGAHDQ